MKCHQKWIMAREKSENNVNIVLTSTYVRKLKIGHVSSMVHSMVDVYQAIFKMALSN
ncbi:hypothetical protein RchiOBHm_Chr5g0053061 [Rosa chinensis]|uniref:Uncharacterized protein n=1 Tax=Rosa chinensis TaxID=74649 RepID=A0A2P6QFU7_ROSCH|nr:hypothetical protein RchiOBHm_Chr5g0053061 [Rosa chinensis]